MSNRFEQPGNRVRVEVDGVILADSKDVIALHEGSLPVRYYFPKDDVRLDLLDPSDTVTRCLWKGTARYWSADIEGQAHRDILWGYDTPLPEAEAIAGRVSFYNEKVDILLD